MMQVEEPATVAGYLVSKQDLVDRWEEFEVALQRWESQTGPLVQWKDRSVKPVTQELEDQFADLGKFLNHSDFAPEAREGVLAMDGLWAAIQEWANRLQAHPNKTDPTGGREVWHHLEIVREALREKFAASVEPIEQLVKEGVKPSQIAKMYGWYNPDGSPDLLRVNRETRNPGSEMDWDKWVHPDKIAAQKKIDLAWQERRKLFGSDDDIDDLFRPETRAQRDRARWNDPGIAPEPIEELLRLEGMTVEQVARMKGVTVDEVYAVASEVGVPIDHHAAAMMARGQTEKGRKLIEKASQKTAADVETYREIPSTKDRVWAMDDDGVKPGLILAGLLHSGYSGLTYSDVVSYLKEKAAFIDGTGQRPAGDAGQGNPGQAAKSGRKKAEATAGATAAGGTGPGTDAEVALPGQSPQDILGKSR